MNNQNTNDTLDAVLRQASVETGDLSQVENRILARARMTPQGRRSQIAGLAGLLADIFGAPFRMTWLFAPGGGLVAAALVGFFIGFSGNMTTAPTDGSWLLDPVYYEAVSMPAPLHADIDPEAYLQ